MTSKDALLIIEHYSTVNEIAQDEMQLDFDNALNFIKQALTKLEDIKSTDSSKAMKALKNLWNGNEITGKDFTYLNNFIRKSQAQEKELEIYKKLIVITSNGVKLNLDMLIELKKLVGENDE